MTEGHETRKQDLRTDGLLREEQGEILEKKVHYMGGTHDMKAERGPWGGGAERSRSRWQWEHGKVNKI